MKKSILETVHESAKGLYDAVLLDVKTLREIDGLCLPKIKTMSPSEIKKIRLREKVSQAVFALYLNISPSTVKQWESGEKHPSGATLKLLNIVYRYGLAGVS
jgi:putative transcriptional regulator